MPGWRLFHTMRQLIAGALIAALVAGCTPKADPPQATATLTERSVTVVVPEGFDAPFLEFATKTHGYGMFVKQGTPALARLFRTTDGGQSWHEVTHPRAVADNHQLYVAGPDTVVLLAEPHSWHVTHDGGKTWTEKPYSPTGPMPDEYPDYTNHELRKGKTVLPGFEESQVVEDGQHRLWQASVRDGKAVTAVSVPGSTSFSLVPVELQPGRNVMLARIAVSPDGLDVWLIAEQEPPSLSGPRSVRMKASGLPLLWRWENGAWKARPVTGVKDDPQHSYSVTPVGAGTLMLTAPIGTGYFTDRLTLVPGTPKLSWSGLLADGTVWGSGQDAGVVYLSTGSGSQRDWIRVQLSRS